MRSVIQRLVLVSAVAIICAVSPGGLVDSSIHTWNWYHYILGSKYFAELGYTDLYEQSVVARRGVDSPIGDLKRVRDLRSYRTVRVADLEIERSPRFTDARWAEFQRDLSILEPMIPAQKWRKVLRDRGYNATPAWDAAFAPIAKSVDLANPTHRRLMKSIDIAGFVALLWLISGTFGVWRAVAVAVAILLFPPTLARFMGGSIKYDWLYVILLVPLFLKRDRPGWAGAAIGVATAMRVFPAVFLFGFAVRGAVRLFQDRRLPHREVRIAIGFLAAIVLGVGLGAAPPGGLDRWAQFGEAIGTHNDAMTYGDGRVGLKHAATWSPDRPKHRLRDRKETFDGRRPGVRMAQGVMLLLLVVAAARAPEEALLVLSSGVLFTLTVASHYYWAIVALGCLLGTVGSRGPPGTMRQRAAVGASLAILPTVAYYLAPLGSSEYLRWVAADVGLLVGFLLLIGTTLGSSKVA